MSNPWFLNCQTAEKSPGLYSNQFDISKPKMFLWAFRARVWAYAFFLNLYSICCLKDKMTEKTCKIYISFLLPASQSLMLVASPASAVGSMCTLAFRS